MNRMPRVGCDQVREVAPELALGLLTGRERAAHLAHLESCGSCRAEVSALATAADDVLLAGPRSSPPEGFDRRVLDRLAAAGALSTPTPEPQPHRPRPRRRVLAVAALALAAVGAVGAVAGVTGLTGDDDPPVPVVATAEMRTGTGRLVGDVSVQGDDPAVVAVDLPGWSELVDLYDSDDRGSYWLAVELDDGSRTMNRIPTDDTAWEVPLWAGAGEVAAVSVVDAEGRAWCTGRFPA
jgi:hypothetical protein